MPTPDFNTGAEANPKLLVITDEAARLRITVRQSAIDPILFRPDNAGPQLYPSFDPKAYLNPIEKTVRGALKSLGQQDPNLRGKSLVHEEEFEKPIGVDPYVLLPVGTEVGTDNEGRPVCLNESLKLSNTNSDPTELFQLLQAGFVPGRSYAGYRLVDDPLDGLTPATFMRAWLRRVDPEEEAAAQKAEDKNKPAEVFKTMLSEANGGAFTEYEVIGMQPHQYEAPRDPQQGPLVGVRIFDRMNYLNWLHGSPGSGTVSKRFADNATRPAALGSLKPIMHWKLPPTRHPQPTEFRMAMHASKP